MDVRLLIPGLAALVVLGLAGCSGDETGASASAADAGVEPVAQAASRTRREPRNHIELIVDGETYRADTASSFGHTFLSDSVPPRYNLEMTSAWLGSNEMSIVKLRVLSVDDGGRTISLDGTGAQAPALMLTELPGLKEKRWRSVAGSMELQFEIADPRTQPVTRATGRFDATVRELHRYRDDFLDDGQELTVSGSFDYDKDRR